MPAVLYANPDINCQVPLPVMLFPAFKTGYHLFASDYNLADKSEGMFPPTVSLFAMVSFFCHALCSYQISSYLCTSSFIIDVTVTVDNDWNCSNICHCYPMNLIQFLDAKIAGYQHTHPGQAKIFGFVAVRDTIKPLRNYVYRRSIHNCEAVCVKRKTVILSVLYFISLQLLARMLLFIMKIHMHDCMIHWYHNSHICIKA